MSTMKNEEIAAQVEAAALAVPGVTTLLRSGFGARAVVDAGARLLGLDEGRTSAVRVEQEGEDVSVECSVGLVRTRSVVETVHELHGAIAAAVLELTGLPARIRITVGHVDEAGR